MKHVRQTELNVDDDWSGRVALVTGGTAGIGRAVVDGLFERGASVLVVARHSERLRELDGSQRVVTYAGDLTRTEVAELAVQRCLDAFGGIDVLVNVAGGTRVGTTWDADDDEWNAMLSLNLLSAVRTCRAAAPHLRRRPASRIVNVGTELVYMPGPDLAPYVAAKAALLVFTKSLSCALAPDVLVNAVCPGTVASEWVLSHFDEQAAAVGRDTEQEIRSFVDETRRIPLRRLGRPAEIAAAIIYLASVDCSYMTGSVIRSDGGSVAYPF